MKKLLLMNTKKLKIILGCTLASLFFACNFEVKHSESENNCKDKVEIINPNGDSELALLMRKMYLDADKIKQKIINNEDNIADDFIAELEKVHTANPTDKNVKTPEFTAFNNLLINQAKELKKKSANKKEAFNSLVVSCINCHQSFCPGPIKRIKKLKINTTAA